MNTSIFKAYDIRGLYPSEVNESIIKAVANVCDEMLGPGPIVVAYDARYGSKELSELLEKNLPSREVISVGLSTTPMFYFLVNHLKAAGGYMITASHNPKEYNGIKMVRAKAVMVPGTEILNAIQNHESK